MSITVDRPHGSGDDASRGWVPYGVRHDLTWDERVRRHRQSLIPSTYPSWQPDPLPEPPVAAIRPAVEPAFEPVRPGLMRLYAARLAHVDADRTPIRESSPDERLLVGELDGEDGPLRTMALVHRTNPIGRGCDEHYRALHPPQHFRYRRFRCGVVSMPVRQPQGMPREPMPEGKNASSLMRRVFDAFGTNTFYPRMGGTKRALLATCAALVLVVSAASTSLAQQFRYEVQPGDSIASIATTFGVDPAAIRTSSYLPNGDVLQAGQVIIIPEPGQSPTDAAQMAAANVGTSPWATTVHWVEWGENPVTIAAMYGVSVNELMDVNGIADPLDLRVGARLVIPAPAPGSDTGPGSSAVVVSGVPLYKQQRNLSCEFAATHAAAMAFGWAPSEEHFIASVPKALNPHYGYRGNIDGWWGNTDDFGVYAEPLVPVLNDWGFEGEVMYTMGDTGPLIAHLDAGHPVVTWLGFWGDTRERLTDDDTYSVFAGMHVVTVYGYDDAGVWAMDPGKGENVHYSWEYFTSMWSVIDGMSLAVYPS